MTRQHSRWYWLRIAAFAALLLLYAERRDLYGLYLDYEESKARAEHLEEEVDSLRADRVAVEKQVENLDNDPLEMEAAIRRGKRLVREGEIVYRVPLPGEEPESIE